MDERRHTTSTRYDDTGVRGTKIADLGIDGQKDTCCTARWVAVSGLCDSLSSVKICLSPSSCGCHAIFIVFFNSTTVTRSLPSLTSQINGSSLQRSLSLSFLLPLPCDRTANPSPSAECSVRTVVVRGGATPFLRTSSGKGRLPCFRFTCLSARFPLVRENSRKPVRETRILAGHRRVPRVGTPIATESDNNAVRRGILKPESRLVRYFRCRAGRRGKI